MNQSSIQISGDKKVFAIGVLSLTAALLLIGNYFAPQHAVATTTIKDRDFSMVTAAVQTGGESLYVLDNRSGRVAVYAYDPTGRVIRPRGIGEMANLFARNNDR
jgi:hypothetical protein